MISKSLKKKWIDALRSGTYEQGRGQLRTVSNEFCCLGVLCDVVDPNKWNTPEECDTDYQYDGVVGVLPHELRKLLSYGQATLRNHSSRLIDMNDDGASFDEIATWIDRNIYSE